MYYVKKGSNELKNNLFDGFSSLFNEDRKLRTDIIEDKDSYQLFCEVPGIKKENINLELEDSVLTISINSNKEQKDDSTKYIRHERFSVSSKRSFFLDDCDDEKVKAKLNDGILEIKVMKKNIVEKENKRNINIE